MLYKCKFQYFLWCYMTYLDCSSIFCQLNKTFNNVSYIHASNHLFWQFHDKNHTWGWKLRNFLFIREDKSDRPEDDKRSRQERPDWRSRRDRNESTGGDRSPDRQRNRDTDRNKDRAVDRRQDRESERRRDDGEQRKRYDRSSSSEGEVSDDSSPPRHKDKGRDLTGNKDRDNRQRF